MPTPDPIISPMPKLRPASTNPVVYYALISIIFGGLAGGIVGYSVGSGNGLRSLTGQTGTIQTRLSVKEESATIEVVARANPAVVSIIITKDFSKVYEQQPVSPFDRFFGFPLQQQTPQGKQEIGGGTGYIVTGDGMIVTNKHVVSDDQAEYTVVMNDGKKYPAKVLAKDPVNDVAVIKIEASDLPVLPLGDSDAVQVGQTVIAIGNALGEYRNTVTKGIISGKARTIVAGDANGESETLENVFQTDAAINKGNSGGPLVDLAGSVIGMNSAVDQQGQSVGFAIPVNVIKKDLESVKQTGKIVQPYLGVRYVLITSAYAEQNRLPVDHGALVQAGSQSGETAVVPDSPAAKAGIVANDILTEVNGKKITTDQSLVSLLQAFKPGDTVTLRVFYDGAEKDVKVTLEERK